MVADSPRRRHAVLGRCEQPSRPSDTTTPGMGSTPDTKRRHGKSNPAKAAVARKALISVWRPTTLSAVPHRDCSGCRPGPTRPAAPARARVSVSVSVSVSYRTYISAARRRRPDERTHARRAAGPTAPLRHLRARPPPSRACASTWMRSPSRGATDARTRRDASLRGAPRPRNAPGSVERGSRDGSHALQGESIGSLCGGRRRSFCPQADDVEPGLRLRGDLVALRSLRPATGFRVAGARHRLHRASSRMGRCGRTRAGRGGTVIGVAADQSGLDRAAACLHPARVQRGERSLQLGAPAERCSGCRAPAAGA